MCCEISPDPVLYLFNGNLFKISLAFSFIFCKNTILHWLKIYLHTLDLISLLIPCLHLLLMNTMQWYFIQNQYFHSRKCITSSCFQNTQFFSGLRVLSNKIWWLCLLPTSTTRFASDVGYRMAIKWVGLYKEILFMNNDIKFLNIEWRTPYPLTKFEDCVGLRASVIFLYSNMCGFLFICTLASSQTLVVKWQN